MILCKIIFGILALIPACFPTSYIKCIECKSTCSEIERKNIPKLGTCNAPLPQGGNCLVKRSQIYYRCSKDECGAIIVKNKEIFGPQEGCIHDNRRVVQKIPKIPQLPSPETSSSSSAVRKEILPGGTVLHHFLEVKEKE
ncbi:hypothetical protein PGT21_016529 [Puccinia graminis f. sp. tritici]|uniref:Uncharacterized protein n=1 Tax=Puccinia graminis f. sp. tritici TaxID=56615 RepID=A0A5B0MBJ3_PUCGR|nr:hypothetical protein PGT21_015919 [Puccinia graminis f. sp. tritici]KAA1073583.1 hypothetical protein PGT21_016529 [Puccinia graminis f. sp. tritici]KAA1122161.1 hypothetical protein PGTUg99_030551 [Puccinia graminis f. sp. tritici]KAA1122171.1 hypothetical protein PGTUg99_031630 [Puccinia graminis f. sp. tritici]